MSTTIDSRVVEMRFDNQHFEKNVQTSLSTLDKLKQKLNLSGASKGLESINAAAKNNNMPALGRSVEEVHAKFSALQVIGVTALANITNSALNAGKRIASALTIDPIKTGFQEYETQINSVQTILANTQHQGTNIKQVNAALDELNAYADKTIYNFTEMTRNIGTFTAAGIDLDTSVNAIQGIANLAAVSGSTSQQASTAMYQLSQALATGTVRLMDWNSVVNAGMGGKVFQDALTETSEKLGTGAEAAIKAQGSFRESLQTGWLTSEVLTETLKKFTTSGANEYIAEYTGLSVDAVEAALKNAEAQYGEAEAIDKAAEALAKKSGKSKEEIKSALQMAKNAEEAATKVKTFTQLWDVLKEAAQSGWAQTWRLIVGDFEEAKGLFTPLSDFLTGIINSMSDARNKLLEGALGKGFSNLKEKITGTLEPLKKTADSVKQVADTVKNYGEVVNKIIGGEFGNGAERIDKLTKAGYDWAHAQNLVNEKLGDSTRHATDYKEAQESVNKSQEKASDSQKELTEADAKRIESLTKLSDAELKAKGYTEEQIKSLRELAKVSEKLGIPIKELIMNIDEINGRWLLMNSFKNIGQGIVKTFTAIGQAWRDIFPRMSSNRLFDIIAGFHKFSTKLVMTKDTAEDLRDTFKGLFAALDIVASIAGGGLKIAFEVLKAVLSVFDMDILDLTAKIGNTITKFHDWLEANNLITKAVKAIVPIIVDAGKSVVDFVKSFADLPIVGQAIDGIKEAFSTLWEVITDPIDTIKEIWSELFSDSAGKAIAALTSGVKRCVDAFLALEPVKNIISNVRDAIKDIWNTLSGLFGEGVSIDSFVKQIEDAFSGIEKWIGGLNNTEHLGRDIVLGIAKGIKTAVGEVVGAIVNIATTLIEAFCSILGIHSPSTVFIAIGAFIIMGLTQGLEGSASTLWSWLKGFADNIINIVSEAIQKGIPWIIDIVKTLGSGIMTALKEADIDFGAIFAAGSIIATLLLFKKVADIADKVVSPLGSIKKAFDTLSNSMKRYTNAKILKIRADAIKSLAIALGILAGSLYLLSTVKWQDLVKAGVAMAGLVGAMFVLSKVAEKMDAKEFGKTAGLLMGISTALLIMSYAVKNIASVGSMEEATAAVLQLGILMAGMAALFYVFGKFVQGDAAANMGKAGLMLIEMSIALALITKVISMIAGIPESELQTGLIRIAMVEALFLAVIMISSVAGANASKAGSMLIKMALAIGILTFCIEKIGGMSWGTIGKGMAVIAGIEILFAALVAVSFFAGRHASKAGNMILKMSIAIGILALSIKAMGNISEGELINAMKIIGMATALFAGFIALSFFAGKNASKAGSMLLKMSAAIAILAITIRLVAGISSEDIDKGIEVIAKFGIMMGILIAVSKLAGANAAKAGTMLLKMSVAMLVLVGCIAILSFIKPEKMWNAVAAISVLLVIFGGLIAVTYLAKDCQKTIMLIVVAVGMLSAALALLSMLDPEKLRNTSLCLGGVMAMFALMTAASGKAKKSMGTIIALTVAVAAIGGVLYLLAGLPIGSTLAAAAGLSIVLLAISVSFKIISSVQKDLVSSLVPLAALVGAVVILGLVLKMLAGLPAESAIASAVALSILLGALTACFVIISNTKGNIVGAAPALLALSGAVAILAVIMGVLTALDCAPSMETALALSTLLLTLSVSMAIISYSGPMATAAIPALYAMVGAVALLAVITGALTALDCAPSLETALALSTLLLSMSAACIILAAVGAAAPMALAGAAALDGVIVIIGGLMVGLGALMTYVPQMEEFLNRGIDVLVQIGSGLGRALGSFVSGALTEISSSLPKLGADLSAFMINATPFIAGAKMIDEGVATGIKSLAQCILILTGAGILEGLTSWLTGGSSIVDFGRQLAEFGPYMAAYGRSVAGIDAEAIKVSAQAAKALVEVAKAVPNEGGLIAKITGENDLAAFAQKLAPFGRGMKAYATAVAGIDTAAITSSTQAAKALVDVANAVPNEGGLMSKITGENDLAAFGAKLVPFGMSLRAYAVSVAGVDTAAITTSVSAAKAIIGVANAIPESGGLIAKITGDNDIAAFGAKLVPFGMSLKTYSMAVSGIDVGAIVTSTVAAKALIALSRIIPEESLWDKFKNLISGDDGGSFVTKLVPFAKGMKSYSMAVVGIDAAAISASAISAKALVKIANTLSGMEAVTFAEGVTGIGTKLTTFGIGMRSYSISVTGINAASIVASVPAASAMIRVAKIVATANGIIFGEGIATLGAKLTAVGNSMKNYSLSVAGINAGAIASSVSAAQSIVRLINSMAGINTSGVASFTSALTKLGNVSLNGFIKAFSSKTATLTSLGRNLMTSITTGVRSGQASLISSFNTVMTTSINIINSRRGMFTTAGTQLATSLANGVKSQLSSVTSAISSTVSSAARAIRGQYSSFYSAGSYLGSGLVLGINSKRSAAYNAGYKLGKAAADGEKAGQKSNSPSKLTIQAGKWLGEGLVIGMGKMTSTVYKSGYSMGETATKSLSSAISSISDIVNSDIDAQPTIRPVMDLSDVKSGAASIGDMLAIDPSVGVLANVNGINSMMNRRIQNGGNGEVVSAINKLRKELGSLERPSYNINGVTYDDGSNISEAVETIVRAARIERRV